MPKQGKGAEEDMLEVVRIDLEKYNMPKDLAQDRSKWRNRYHVADPNTVGRRL